MRRSNPKSPSPSPFLERGSSDREPHKTIRVNCYISWRSGRLHTASTALEAEAQALLQALQQCWIRGYTFVVFEDAERKLAQLRRDYAKKVKVFRKEYIHEIEMLRVEKQRKDEARLLAERAANEERRKLKAEAAKVRAEERKIADEEFRQTLMKERAEKLEIWKMMGKKREEKIKERAKLLREQSSLWIEHKELERKITEALVDTVVL